jgi:hypothetical protein
VTPRRRTVTVYQAQAQPLVLRETDTLDGGAVLPGLRCPVRAVFT